MKATEPYDKLISKLEKCEDDNEGAHILQDQIYRKFIRDICFGKLASLAQIREVAELLKDEVVRRDADRWYA